MAGRRVLRYHEAMPRILSIVPLDAAAVRRLEALSGGTIETVPPQEGWWDLPTEVARDPEIMLCKFPPRNLQAMNNLKFLQLATVGYEHLRHLHLAELPWRTCN